VIETLAMTETSSKSSRVFIRYNNASSVPTDDDIRNIFSVHGQIVGKFYII